MKPIDLAQSYDEMPMPMPVSMKEREKHYPSFTYQGEEELELPKEGQMTISFREVASSNSERNGKKRYTCTIEVLSIDEVECCDEVEAPASSGSDAEEALDTLMEAHMAKKAKAKESY